LTSAYTFQKRKVGDAVGVKSTPPDLLPQLFRKLFGPEYLSVAEAKGFNVVSGEKPLADFKLGGQNMRNIQVPGQGGNRVGSSVGNDHYSFPLIEMMTNDIRGLGIDQISDGVLKPLLAELHQILFASSDQQPQEIPVGLFHVQKVVAVKEIICYGFHYLPPSRLSPTKAIAHERNTRIPCDQGFIHIEETDQIHKTIISEEFIE